MKKNIKLFFTEIITVIIGILIALFINNWNEDRKERKYIDTIFTSITKELEDTHDDVIATLSQQKSNIDTLDFYMNDETVSLKDIVIKTNGVNIPTVKLHSWNAISNSKIELVNYERIAALSNIEQQSKILISKTDRMGDFLYANINETTTDKKEIMKMLFLDIMGSEQQVLAGIALWKENSTSN